MAKTINLAHVKSEMKKHKGKKFKEILKLAKKLTKNQQKVLHQPALKQKEKRRRRRKSKGKRTAKKSKKEEEEKK